MEMKNIQTIGLIAGIGLLSAWIFAPTIYAVEDGQFPVFPTVIENGGATAPASQPVIEEVKTEPSVKKDKDIVTSESGVFSPWGTLKQALFGRAQAGEEGVVFALEAESAKPSGRGDLRYRIAYANNTDKTLRNVRVEVFLPRDLQYLDSDLRPDSKEKGVVTFKLGKIAAGEEGAVKLETRLKKKNAKETVLQATMTYEDVDGGRHTVTASANNAFRGNGGLTASALDSFGGLVFWLVLIVLISALAFVSYR
ncbi:MAG: hypothetical protein HYW00_02415, partial [Candidatus Colwellbacteria bacterium]|nr:hypothetical protein [Candidatus Colwellbacteria bacterium]